MKANDNPVTYFFVIISLVLFFGLVAFFVAWYKPGSTGQLFSSPEFEEVYRSNEEWSFQLNDYHITFLENSVIAPVYESGNLAGLTVRGKGQIKQPSEVQIDSLFIALDEEKYYQIKGDTIFSTIDAPGIKEEAIFSARGLVNLPGISCFGFKRVFPPSEDSFFLYIEKNGVGSTLSSHPFNEVAPFFLLYFGSVLAMNLLVLQLLTYDLSHGSKMKDLLAVSPPALEILLAAGFVIGAFLTKHFSNIGSLPDEMSVGPVPLYTGFIFLLFTVSRKRFIPVQNFGLTGEHMGRSLLMPPLIAFILTSFSALQLPTGIAAGSSFFQVLLLFLSSLLYAFTAELFWRGYLQTFLERMLGLKIGLLTSTLICAGFFMLLALFDAEGFPLPSGRYVELVFFGPAIYLLLGIVFQRSRNICSPALLHALVLFLPQVLAF